MLSVLFPIVPMFWPSYRGDKRSQLIHNIFFKLVLNWFLGSAWEPNQEALPRLAIIRGRASQWAFPGRAWERVIAINPYIFFYSCS